MATRTRTKAEVATTSLMEAVVERGNLRLAYQRVVENKGAAGVDELTVAELKDHLKRHWPTIRARLLAGEYQPEPVRRVDIPKPQGGVRTLGIPTVVDRLIQQALHQVLQPIFEPTFSEASYGFRPGRNAHQALRQARAVRGERQALGGGHGPGEVLQPGQPRPVDEQAGDEDWRCTSADADPAVSGSGHDGGRIGAAAHGGHAARRAAVAAAVQHPAHRAGPGTGTTRATRSAATRTTATSMSAANGRAWGCCKV